MKPVWFDTGLRLAHEFLEDQWFDRTRNVRTSGNVTLHRAGVGAQEQRDSELYQPARPAHIRRAVREALADDLSSFSFIVVSIIGGKQIERVLNVFDGAAWVKDIVKVVGCSNLQRQELTLTRVRHRPGHRYVVDAERRGSSEEAFHLRPIRSQRLHS